MHTLRLATLIAIPLLAGCSTASPDVTTPNTTAPATTASDTTQQNEQNEQGLGELSLSSETEALILDWYNDQDHKGERRSLTLIAGEAPLIKATEHRFVSRNGRQECLEGELYIRISPSHEITSQGWGHDCCPGTQCQPEMETFMARLFARVESDDLRGIADFIHPTKGIQITQEYLDREEPEHASLREEYLTPRDVFDGVPTDVFVCPAHRSNAIMSCWATSDDTPGALPSTFTCSCRAGGDESVFIWEMEGSTAYLTAFEQIWQN